MAILAQSQQTATPLGENQDYSSNGGTDTTAIILDFYRAIGLEKYQQIVVRATKQGEGGQKDHTIILSGTMPAASPAFSLRECSYRNGDYMPNGRVHPDGAAYLRELGAAGYGIFCYPHHPTNGIAKVHCPDLLHSIFYEIDDLPLDKQWGALFDLVADTELVPAAVVFSGGKSLHCYFRSEPLSQEQWLILNRLLCIKMQSDPAICSIGRAMRLPGVARLKGGETREVSLDELNFAAPRYTYTELFTSLGGDKLPYGIDDERWRLWRRAKSPAEKYQALHAAPTPPRRYHPPQTTYDLSETSGRIALADLIPSSLTSGTDQGGRNQRAFAVASHALATEDWARGLSGISIDGDARGVFDDFCLSCHPAINSREAEKIWKSAARGYGALDSSAIEIKERIIAKKLGAKKVTPAVTPPRLKGEGEGTGEGEDTGPGNQIKPIAPPRFTATIVTSGDYLPSDITPTGLYAINAGMGAGKTHLLERICRGTDTPEFLNIGHRVSLLRQTTERLGGDNYQDIPNEVGRITGAHISSSNLSITINSLLRLDFKRIGDDFKKLIFDEITGIAQAILFDSTVDGIRLQAIKAIEFLLSRAEGILALDANMGDEEIKLLSALAPHLPVTAHRHNRIIKNPITVHIANGFDNSGRYRRDAKKNLEQKIFDALAKGEKIFFISDSKGLCESVTKEVATVLGEELDKGLSQSCKLITSATAGEDWARDFLQKPDDYLADTRFLALSPSGVTGISILSEFDRQIGIFSGLPICAGDISQMIGRARNCKAREIFIPAFAGDENPAYDAAAEKAKILKQWEDEGKRCNAESSIDAAEINPAWLEYAAYRKWLDKIEKKALADSAAGYLENSGYEVKFLPFIPDVGDEIDEKLRQTKKELMISEATAIAAADDLTATEYAAMKQGNNKIDDQRRIAKYEFKATYPGVDATMPRIHSYLYDRAGDAITLAALLTLPDADAKDYLKISRNRRYGCPWLSSPRAARYDAIRKILELIDGREISAAEDFAIFNKLEKFKSEKVAGLLGVKISEMSATQAISQILQLAGRKLKMENRTKVRRSYVVAMAPLVTVVVGTAAADKKKAAADNLTLWEELVAAAARRISESVKKFREMEAKKAAEMAAAGGEKAAAETLGKMSPPPIYISKGGLTSENQSQEQRDDGSNGGGVTAAAGDDTTGTTGDITTGDNTTAEDITTGGDITTAAIITGISQWLQDKNPDSLAIIPYSDDVETVIYRLPSLNSFLRNELINSWQSVTINPHLARRYPPTNP